MKRTSWVICMDPKFTDKLPYETHGKDLMGRGEGPVRTKAETGVLHHRPRCAHSHQMLEEANGICLRDSEGGVVLPTP